jgi:site-specific DNA-methyltransferase (adenine-specific)
MNQMPAKSIGGIVTSPPYNLRTGTGNGMHHGGGSLWRLAQLRAGYSNNLGDNLPYDKYVKWQRDCLSAMLRLLRDDGAIFYNHKWRVQDGLLQDRSEIVRGFPVRQIIIWQRSGGINFNCSYFLPTYEVIYLICNSRFRLAKSSDPKHPKATCGIGDVWSVKQDRNNPHPAPFPVEIPKRCIQSISAEVILDPFSGSGTTALAAEMLDRKWIGIDVVNTYCESARKRIAVYRILRYVARQLATDY